jgi:hypothetical protein
MKFQISSTVVGALALALVLVSAPVEGRAAAQSGPQISRKEAKELMHHASAPEDYRKLSAYFEQEAQSLEARAREHEEEADHYASTPGIQPKVPYPGGWVTHCRFLASEYKLEAQKASAEADHYNGLAGGRGETAHLAQAMPSISNCG